jgi:hypothetical protein
LSSLKGGAQSHGLLWGLEGKIHMTTNTTSRWVRTWKTSLQTMQSFLPSQTFVLILVLCFVFQYIFFWIVKLWQSYYYLSPGGFWCLWPNLKL